MGGKIGPNSPKRRPYRDPEDPSVWRIPLADGGYALVDEEDVCRVEAYPWYRFRSRGGRREYAISRWQEDRKQITVWMHRLVYALGPDDRPQVDHKNHDGLDNRRSNLRLASAVQNTANSRCQMDKKSSIFKGVSLAGDRWPVNIASNVFGPSKTIGLGRYGTEGEAAFAFQAGARFLRDPDFLHLEPIPPDMMPAPHRQAEIEAIVIAKIKARLEGRKGKLDSTSRYSGVDYRPNVSASRPWRAMTSLNRKTIYLGYYPDEAQAALAYNVVLERYPNPHRRLPNVVPESEMPPDEVVRSIRENALAILSRPPRKIRDWSWLTLARYESLFIEHGSLSAVADHLGVRMDYLKTILGRMAVATIGD